VAHASAAPFDDERRGSDPFVLIELRERVEDEAAVELLERLGGGTGLRHAHTLEMKNDRLQLGHLLDRRARALLADAAPLQPAVGHNVGAPKRRRIDLDRPAVDLAREAKRAVEIRREEAGAEPVGAVVCELIAPSTSRT